uniref:Venom protein n=1 Tax=Centruroides hentzi TaxID=88313 RepID=A0A2I9LPZ1_9SCOR
MFQVLTLSCLIFSYIYSCQGEDEDGRLFFNFIFSDEGRKLLRCFGTFGFSYSMKTDIRSKMEAQEKLCNCTASAIKGT